MAAGVGAAVHLLLGGTVRSLAVNVSEGNPKRGYAEAVQTQAGHRSIESTRAYLHLANDWSAKEVSAS
ncbi:MAG: hypothetical protein ABI862_11900 [Ilumatobacteraceae bacterium]